MITLYILRHGKAAPQAAGGSDFERALAPRGLEDAARAAAALKGRLPSHAPGAVSAAQRTQETARVVGNVLGWEGPDALLDGYLAPAAFWLAAVNGWPDGCDAGLLIGHNPGLSDLVSELTDAPVWLPTAGLAEVTFEVDRWAEVSRGCGILRGIWTPKSNLWA